MQQLKKIIGNNAHWTINKELARHIGIEATLLLQHLIDLRENYFKKGTPFYQQQNRLSEELGLSEHVIRKATKILVDNSFVSVKREGIPPKYHWTINDVNLYRFFNLTYIDEEFEPLKVKKVDHKHKEKHNTNKNNTNTEPDKSGSDATRQEEKKKLDIEILLDKIIERYPGSINSRGPMLKALKQLNTEERKLALKNIDRYTKAWEGWYHNLRNYLESKQFSEKELYKRETKIKKPSSTINPNHNFSGDYGKIVEDNLEWSF